MDVRCFVVTLQHARVYVCTLLWVYWLAHANDINFVPVCVRVRVCVMCIHIWSVVMNQCECAFVLNVCMRVWIYVCFNSCGVCCVLVSTIYGTCLASNKNSLWICQSTHYTWTFYVVFFAIICYHHHAYFILIFGTHFFSSSPIDDSIDDCSTKISRFISHAYFIFPIWFQLLRNRQTNKHTRAHNKHNTHI